MRRTLAYLGGDYLAKRGHLVDVADSGANGIAALQQLDDGSATNKSASTRYQYDFRHFASLH